MLTFLILGSLAVLALTVGAAGMLVCGILWLVLFPIRWLFKLTFGLIGGLLGILLVPVLMVVVGAVVVAVVAAVFLAVLVPLLPLIAVALIAWAIARGFSRRTSPAI